MIAAPEVPGYAQLRTGRGILIDTALVDVLPYVPGAAPAFERILQDVYGTSLLAAAKGDIYRDVPRLWRVRTAAQWSSIGRSYGATQVLVPADWQLALPEVARSGNLALYQILP